jgi:hypothetical protein
MKTTSTKKSEEDLKKRRPQQNEDKLKKIKIKKGNLKKMKTNIDLKKSNEDDLKKKLK